MATVLAWIPIHPGFPKDFLPQRLVFAGFSANCSSRILDLKIASPPRFLG